MVVNRVPPFGPKDTAKICFIGQSPGKTEQKLGRPFVGPAGKVLQELCVEVGIDPESCFFTNVCDRVLLGNDEPTEKDIDEGKDRLLNEINKLKNLKIIVLVGLFAARLVFDGRMRELSGLEGNVFGYKCIASFHPSATFYASNKEQIREEIKLVLKKAKTLNELAVKEEAIEFLASDPQKFVDKFCIKPTRRSGIAELLGSKPKSKPADMVAPERFSSAIPEPDNWLKNIMDETLEKQQVLWEKSTDSFIGPYFRGSEVSDPCPRSLVLSVMGHRLPIEANLRRIFNTGLAIEESNIRTFREAGVLVGDGQDQINYVDPPILGHIDAIVRKPNKAYCLAEIKSINEYAFKKLPKEHGPMLASESPLFKTHYKYVMQWNCYAGAPNVEFNDEDGFILFEAKNTSAQKFYWLKRDDELLEKMLTRLRLAAPYILSDPMRVPPRSLIEKDNPTHENCPRKYICQAIPDEGATYDEVKKIDYKLRG